MKITVLGCTGMLGHVVTNYFRERYEDVQFSWRNIKRLRELYDLKTVNGFHLDALKFCYLPQSDYVINCIGVIKPFIECFTENAIRVNSLFPLELATYCQKNCMKLIHITTDCVFSGSKGDYFEDDPHDAIDVYGKTKSLGEPTNCMVLRTSIIGEEVFDNRSLVEWVKSFKEGDVIYGYTNHWWNGMTTLQFAKCCDAIITKDLWQPTMVHIFSHNINKEGLLKLITARFDIKAEIKSKVATPPINRTLGSHDPLICDLDMPTIQQQIIEM